MKKTLILILIMTLGFASTKAQVGIGTSSPNAKLDIRGTRGPAATSGNSNNATLRISNGNLNGSSVLDFGSNGDGHAWLQSRSSSDYTLNYPLYLNSNGGAVSINTSQSSAALNVGGTILATGTIRSSAAGQELNRVVLNESDLGISANITNSSGTYTDVITYTYTPTSNKSRILITYSGNYTISGNVGSIQDEFNSQITVGGTSIQEKRQLFVNTGNSTIGGNGFRGSGVFPISAVYKNSSSSNITIKVRVSRTAGDDTITIYPDMLFSIVEIAD